jgi:hypothetical protein
MERLQTGFMGNNGQNVLFSKLVTNFLVLSIADGL